MKGNKMNQMKIRWLQVACCGLTLFYFASMGWAEGLSNFALEERITQLEEKLKDGLMLQQASYKILFTMLGDIILYCFNFGLQHFI